MAWGFLKKVLYSFAREQERTRIGSYHMVLDRELCAAIKANDATRMQELLDVGARLDNSPAIEWGPLHWASYCNAPMAMKVLIEAGANLHATDEHGHTPVHVASMWGCVKATEILLAAGADCERKDAYGTTPLQLARKNRHREVAKILKAEAKYRHTLELQQQLRERQAEVAMERASPYKYRRTLELEQLLRRRQIEVALEQAPSYKLQLSKQRLITKRTSTIIPPTENPMKKQLLVASSTDVRLVC